MLVGRCSWELSGRKHRKLLSSFLFTGIGILIMFHPELESSLTYKLAVLYHWLLAVLIPWLVVRKEKKRIGR